MTTSSGGKRDNRKGQGYSADILATRSRLGREGVERQVKATVNKAVAEIKQKQQQGQQQAYQQRQQRTRHAVNI